MAEVRVWQDQWIDSSEIAENPYLFARFESNFPIPGVNEIAVSRHLFIGQLAKIISRLTPKKEMTDEEIPASPPGVD